MDINKLQGLKESTTKVGPFCGDLCITLAEQYYGNYEQYQLDAEIDIQSEEYVSFCIERILMKDFV